jgi:hypothetical protein
MNQITDYITIGDSMFFIYRYFESDKTSNVDLWNHTNQPVVVLRRLKDKVEVDENTIGRTYHVRFEDGFEYVVFEDELEYQESVMG